MSFQLASYLETRIKSPIDQKQVVTLFADGVRALEKSRTLNGQEKKQLLLETIVSLIKKSDQSEYNKSVMLLLINSMGSVLVDQLVELGNDTHTFIKRHKCWKWWKCYHQ